MDNTEKLATQGQQAESTDIIPVKTEVLGENHRPVSKSKTNVST